MAPSGESELEYLKTLVAQLNEKIHALEDRAKQTAQKPKTPAQQLRTILVGPPGSGTFPNSPDGVSPWVLTRPRRDDRQGYTGPADTRRVLCLPSRDGRHAA